MKKANLSIGIIKNSSDIDFSKIEDGVYYAEDEKQIFTVKDHMPWYLGSLQGDNTIFDFAGKSYEDNSSANESTEAGSILFDEALKLVAVSQKPELVKDLIQ